MAKFLLVEDDLELADVLKAWFSSTGNILEHAETGEDALQLLKNFKYDLIILDWMLPGLSGKEVCKQFRDDGGSTPVIFTTARGDIESKEQGLDLGGDDYLVKPYDVRELAARIRSVMRRPVELLPTDLRIGDLVLDTASRTLTANGQELHLMPKEAALLEYLLRHPNRACGSQTLLDVVWPSDSYASADTVRTWIKNLRAKLAGIGKEDLIKTIPRSGYLIQWDEQ